MPRGEKLQSVGREFGVTTDRRRVHQNFHPFPQPIEQKAYDLTQRCGWLDLIIVKYSTAGNHYTALNLTKLDVLDTFPEIKIATAYHVDRHILDSFPADLELLARAEVVYKTNAWLGE